MICKRSLILCCFNCLSACVYNNYEKASLRAWNNTVLEVKKDQQYSSATPQDGNIDLYTKKLARRLKIPSWN